MSKLFKLCKFLGLIREQVQFKHIEPVVGDYIYIPPGAIVEGEIHTSLKVIVAGNFQGSLNIRGTESIVILEGAQVSHGLISADHIELSGTANDVNIDVGFLEVKRTGSITGRSDTRNKKLRVHDDALIEGYFERRVDVRDGTIHLPRSSVLISESRN